MSYAAKFLITHGQPCTVLRTPPVQGYVSLKRVNRSTTDLGAREAYWEGLASISDLASGDIVQIEGGKYLALSTGRDPASSERAVLVVKTNAVLTHKKYTETVDGDGHIAREWVTLNADVPAFGQIVTAELRQYSQGLVDAARHLFLISKNVTLWALTMMPPYKLETIKAMNRIIFNEANYQVESIDEIGLPGVFRVQLGVDVRP